MNWQTWKRIPRKLRVDNLTRGQNLVTKGAAAANIASRLRGLIGRPRLVDGEGLLILPCTGVHTHFMRYPIDVLYVNPNGEIIAMDQAMAPWRFGRIHSRARFVVEIPAGTVASTGTQIGDRLLVKGMSGRAVKLLPLFL